MIINTSVILLILLGMASIQVSAKGLNLKANASGGINTPLSKPSFTYGANIGFYITDHLSVVSGYEHNKFFEQSETEIISVSRDRSYHSIPLNLNFDIRRFALIGGISLYHLSNATLNINTNIEENTNSTSYDIFNEYKRSMIIYQIGLEYELYNRVNIGFTQQHSIASIYQNQAFNLPINSSKIYLKIKVF